MQNYTFTCHYQGQKRKNKGRGNNLEEMIMLMEKRADEREEKMIKLYTEIEDRRSETERESMK